MNCEGRPLDGKPILGGDRFLTRFGTATSPYPSKRHERHASQWLIDNAVAHAEAAGDGMNAVGFRGERPNKQGGLPQGSVACMLIYLFSTDLPV